MPMNHSDPLVSKQCAYCLQNKPLSEFRRRTGRRSKGQSRRGACRDCRKKRELETLRSPLPIPSPISAAPPVAAVKPRPVQQGRSRSRAEVKPAAAQAQRPLHPSPYPRGPKPDPQDSSALIPSSKGMILMRGHSDKGRRWHQEIDLELAVTLVKEHAAVVVNRRTIRRLFSNKDFRSYILTRDSYTCHFCGLYGDTIDHLLPRAKGGHTTPDNCVCACNLCNQTKADQYVEEFLGR
ncbi:HNH endonuclease [Paenibacillus sp. sgz500958]|uniref:HNH endonuclease n=1 Tax=Paenibacillus sp. sgz500958 TaxID=3242475 RepID=UPI0036D25AB1